MHDEHAILAPSSAPEWGFCSGSVSANASAPDVSSERAREGTASHWVAAKCLRHGGTCHVWAGVKAPNGIVVDEEIAEGAQVWVDDLQQTCAKHGNPAEGRMVEYRVTMPNIHPENWGTLDSALWLPRENTLYIWEYKYGHREVIVAGNLQLIDYVAGLIVECDMNPETTIIMRVVQPFCYHSTGIIREWSVKLADLTPYIQQLSDSALQALTSPSMTAGAHCRDCHAIARCATAKRAAYSVITYAREPYDIDTLDGPDLALERSTLATGMLIVKARLEALEDDLKARIAKGDKTSGLTVQAGQGRRKWSVPIDQAIALAGQFGVNISKPGAVTPTQALKLVDTVMRAPFEGALKLVTSRPSTGLKLVPVPDSQARRAFKPERK